MSALRIVAPLLTAALGMTGFAATASAAPSTTPPPSTSVVATTGAAAAAASPQCRLRILKVRVLNLQHDVEGVDRAFVRIGNSETTTQSYSPPQTRNTLSTGEERFSGAALVALHVETLGGASTITVGSDFVTCQNATRDFVFANGDARYKVRAVVDVLP